MRISDWSSDVCSSDLPGGSRRTGRAAPALPCSPARVSSRSCAFIRTRRPSTGTSATPSPRRTPRRHSERRAFRPRVEKRDVLKKKSSSEGPENVRSEEHTSELQSLMRISYAVFCLKKKTSQNKKNSADIKKQKKQHNAKNKQQIDQIYHTK